MNVDTVGQAAAAAAAATTPAAAPALAPRQQQQRVVAPAGAPLMSAFFFSFLLSCFPFLSFFLVNGHNLRRALVIPGGEKRGEHALLEGERAKKATLIAVDVDVVKKKNSSPQPPLLSPFSFLFLFLSTKKKKRKTPAIVLQYPHAVEAAARDWADRYQARRASAAAELVNLLVAAVGGEIAVSAADVEEGDIDALVNDLVTSATSHGLLEPFGGSGSGGSRGKGRNHARDARAAYQSLWALVVRELASRGLLGDNYVLEKVIKLLLGLTW